MDRESFKDKYGYYPEEAQLFKAENEKLRAQVSEQTSAQFRADLQTASVTPAAIEVISKSPFSADPAFHSFVKEIIKFASEDKLIVRAGDMVPSSPSVDYKALDEDGIKDAAKKLIEEGKFKTLAEAVAHVKTLSRK